MTYQLRSLHLIALMIGCFWISSCHPNNVSTYTRTEQLIHTQTPTSVAGIPTATPTELVTTCWLDPALPAGFSKQILENNSIQVGISKGDADVTFEIDSDKPTVSEWVYLLVMPFTSLRDDISFPEIKAYWDSGVPDAIFKKPILMDTDTFRSIQKVWGEPAKSSFQIVASNGILDTAWRDNSIFAIIPFEELEPQWKVITIDNQNPLEKTFDASKYPLTISIGVSGSSENIAQIRDLSENGLIHVPATNRDFKKLTIVMVTGTTALTRDIADKMDEKGIEYPAQDILTWFQSADIVHISNEVSFMVGCEHKDGGKFCSKPEYIQLLTAIGTTVVELTGNHLLDFGPQPFLNTLEIYKENEIATYGGGYNIEAARKPFLIEHNGNRIAFLGCNAVGPDYDLASMDLPGANPCDGIWMEQEITSLISQGYNVIFTFQHMEYCSSIPLAAQTGDFIRAEDAGAIIVSGSQAHCPQTMSLYKRSFIHYGLGNLFFDQMDPVARRELVDLHIFYDGKYINTRLLTAILEDQSKPRPMTQEERLNFLFEILQDTTWKK
jgi:hypothetical protein